MNNLKILDESLLRIYRNKDRARPVVAVVGNAGVSDEDNDMIQDADCVVRFNNFATRAGIQHTQTPNHCDILFTTFDLHSQNANPKDVVSGIPFPFKAKDVYLKSQRWYKNAQMWMVNPYTNLQMLLDLKVENSLGYEHPFPSIGTTALWHMKEWDADFYVMGFGWYFDPKTNLFQGWDLKNRQHPTHWNHSYPKEVEWALKTLLTKNNFMFSKNCQKILEIARHKLQ